MTTKSKTKKQAKNKAVVEGAVSQVTRLPLPAGYIVRRAVTLPGIVLKKDGDCRCLRIDEAMHLSAAKMAATGEKGSKEMEPATVCAVTDIVTGEQGNFVVPAVVKGNLDEKYPDASYVGLIFQITHNGKRPGKRYADFTVLELAAA